MIEGNVFDASGAALEGWTIWLFGPVNVSTMTSSSGYYAFMNLPDGDYQVCETLQAGWSELSPDASFGSQCADGNFGWAFSLQGSVLASFADFTNSPPKP